VRIISSSSGIGQRHDRACRSRKQRPQTLRFISLRRHLRSPLHIVSGNKLSTVKAWGAWEACGACLSTGRTPPSKSHWIAGSLFQSDEIDFHAILKFKPVAVGNIFVANGSQFRTNAAVALALPDVVQTRQTPSSCHALLTCPRAPPC
jgi:hypothetical protein